MSVEQSIAPIFLVGVSLACPVCRQLLAVNQTCGRCGFLMEFERGILNALPEARERHYAPFIREYETVRAAEGRGAQCSDFYHSLPYIRSPHPMTAQWQIRSATYDYFVKHVLEHRSNLVIADLGAGNGWLSYRLSLLGHQPIAVDLVLNESDGLGAARRYQSALQNMFPLIRAELDRLPFADHQLDIAVFNASFHYSEDYLTTFGEALRIVKPGGRVVILDTPWYEAEASGNAMVAERRAQFTARFGFPSDALNSVEYLTPQRLARIQELYNVEITTLRPWYGLRWALRPYIAMLKRRRIPSQFRIYVAEVFSR